MLQVIMLGLTQNAAKSMQLTFAVQQLTVSRSQVIKKTVDDDEFEKKEKEI